MSQASTDGLEAFAASVRQLVAEGRLSQAEAEGVLQTFLDRSAPQDAGEATANRIKQMERGRRLLVEGMAQEVGAFQQGTLSRAREGLLQIPTSVWEAAIGAEDEPVDAGR